MSKKLCIFFSAVLFVCMAGVTAVAIQLVLKEHHLLALMVSAGGLLVCLLAGKRTAERLAIIKCSKKLG